MRDEHEAVAAEVGAFGVPTIRLDGGTGPAIFGPVVSEPPGDDEEAVELWRHVSWLVRNPNFHELKRNRATGPDLPYWQHLPRQARAQPRRPRRPRDPSRPAAPARPGPDRAPAR